MYWKAPHCVYDCRYHLVWITKYRRRCLSSGIRNRLEVVLSGICKELYVRPIRIGMEEDHVHLYLTIPVVQPIPYVVQALKGRSSKILRKEFAGELRKHYWKPVLWGVGYFIATVGEVTDEIIRKYVEQQGRAHVEEECREWEAPDDSPG
jgi:putative transposase